jgi:hypothetical protein
LRSAAAAPSSNINARNCSAPSPHPFDLAGTREAIAVALANTDVETAVDEICDWLHTQGWIDDMPPGRQAGAGQQTALDPGVVLEQER